MTEESGEETMTGEDIMATKEVDMAREMKEEQDMKSVGGESGMKVGETEIETTEERETGKVEVQARGMIEEMGEMQTTGAGREIMTEKGMTGIVRRGRIGQLREAWIG